MPTRPPAASLLTCLLVLQASHPAVGQDSDAGAGLGLYKLNLAQPPRPVPVFDDVRQYLPTIVFDDRPDLVRLYTAAWQTAFRHIEQPRSDGAGGYVLARTYVDAAFSDNIFQWDTCFIMGFAKYGHAAFDFIESLDNFYALQTSDGFICREFRKQDALPVMFPTQRDSVNPPLFAWAEVQYARMSGDTQRLARVLPALDRYAHWLEANRSITITTPQRSARLYWNTPFGSGMDNTPEQGDAWVSMSAQMAQMYESLAIIASHAGQPGRVAEYRAQRDRIASDINALMWDDEQGVYFNIAADGSLSRQLTIGCFWPLWAGIAPADRAARATRVLLSPAHFATEVPFATLSRSHEKFDEWGGYWLGASWAPTTHMAVAGLQRSDRPLDAYVASYRYIDAMSDVFADTGTIWENYAPAYLAFGGNPPKPQPGQPSKRDFVGWSGLGPITMLIEDVIGIQVDALDRRVTWRLLRTDRVGVQGLQMGQTRFSLVAQPRETLGDEAVIDVESGGEFDLRLIVEGREVSQRITPGRTQIRVP